jgi:4,5-DOPA dioxygenase extradiol
MHRKKFIQLISATAAMSTLGSLKSFADTLKNQEEKMPLLFVGHGSPMNGIEDNEFSRRWEQMGKDIPQPRAILCISAHWLTNGTAVTAMQQPQTIHDFGGFPQELFDVQYPAPGDPALAQETAWLVHKTQVGLDHEWGLDHGTWSVVKRMYPEAKIPVLQLSIDYSRPGQYHYDLAKELAALRKKGVLIIGSGNMVHNLGMINWSGNPGDDFGYDWALEMNEKFKKAILEDDHGALINYKKFGAAGKNAIPTPDHYFPLLYVMGLKEKNESISFFNDKAVMGSITMTSVKIDK